MTISGLGGVYGIGRYSRERHGNFKDQSFPLRASISVESITVNTCKLPGFDICHFVSSEPSHSQDQPAQLLKPSIFVLHPLAIPRSSVYLSAVMRDRTWYLTEMELGHLENLDAKDCLYVALGGCTAWTGRIIGRIAARLRSHLERSSSLVVVLVAQVCVAVVEGDATACALISIPE
jgi:hypothetical protein